MWLQIINGGQFRKFKLFLQYKNVGDILYSLLSFYNDT